MFIHHHSCLREAVAKAVEEVERKQDLAYTMQTSHNIYLRQDHSHPGDSNSSDLPDPQNSRPKSADISHQKPGPGHQGWSHHTLSPHIESFETCVD